MATIQKLMLSKMAILHATLADFGPLYLAKAAELSGLRKASCKEWMKRLIEIGCVAQIEAPDEEANRKIKCYFKVTDKPFPGQGLEMDFAPYGDNKKSAGVHELSRRVVKAVNMGMPRDYLVAAFFGEKRV